MTISILPLEPTPREYGPPTAVLPPIKSLSSISPDNFSRLLDYLRLIYVPEVRGSRRLLPKPKAPRPDQTTALDVFRDDHFERAHALRWLTASLARFSAEDSTADALLQSAASLLAICAGASAAGALTRRFAFGPIHIELMDTALENDLGSVGAQTWGAACVLADMLTEDPAAFLPLNKPLPPVRVLELGAGTGLVSMTLGKLAQRLSLPLDVVATDNHPAVLDNLRANVDTNTAPGSRPVRVARLDWTEVFATATTGANIPLSLDPALDETFDVIFGADVVYAPEHSRLLHACAARFLRPGGQFHLVVPLRAGHSREVASVEEVFSSSSGDAPSITRKETVVCEGSPKGPGRPSEEIEYWHFVLEWPLGGSGSQHSDSSA
ncbi:unnamed protein product [Peniophora sp. CBMAI 1063]|nr:unnamed protein product [Peniophora sp. CBMAI 1063]